MQKSSGYHKPLFLLFVTHSSFLFLLPCYLLVLRIATGKPLTYFLEQLRAGLILQADDFISRPTFLRRAARHEQLPTQDTEENGAADPSGRHDTFTRTIALTFIIVALMVGLTIPSVSWFLAVPLTSMANITSIYNTFSIWALVLSVVVLGDPWQYRQAFAVLLACCGVGIVAFSSTHGREERAEHAKVPFFSRALVGNILAFLGAVSMASYEVMYKVIGTLPEPDEGPADTAPVAQTEGESTHLNRDPDVQDEAAEDAVSKQSVDLPFGLHAITMTTGIGAATLSLFWIVLLFADMYGFETFELPKQVPTTLWILLSVVCGVLFNGAFSTYAFTDPGD